MTSGPFELSGDLPIGSPEVPAHLIDVAAAYELAELARAKAAAARQLLVAAIETARFDHEEPLATIAEHLGAGKTRQYVQKLLREAEQLAADEEAYARRYEPDAAKRAIGRSSGWKRGTPQCGGCKRFLKRSDDVCPSCGYAGHGGYVGVPASTSVHERWR